MLLIRNAFATLFVRHCARSVNRVSITSEAVIQRPAFTVPRPALFCLHDPSWNYNRFSIRSVQEMVTVDCGATLLTVLFGNFTFTCSIYCACNSGVSTWHCTCLMWWCLLSLNSARADEPIGRRFRPTRRHGDQTDGNPTCIDWMNNIRPYCQPIMSVSNKPTSRPLVWPDQLCSCTVLNSSIVTDCDRSTSLSQSCLHFYCRVRLIELLLIFCKKKHCRGKLWLHRA